jgi:hypothetical protein
MAIGDIFKRKKKGEDFVDLGAVEPGAYGPATQGGYPQQMPMDQFPGAYPQAPMAPMQSAAPAGAGDLDNIRQQLESINYKLDTLKAVLDTLSTRIANVENALKVSPLERQGGF